MKGKLISILRPGNKCRILHSFFQNSKNDLNYEQDKASQRFNLSCLSLLFIFLLSPKQPSEARNPHMSKLLFFLFSHYFISSQQVLEKRKRETNSIPTPIEKVTQNLPRKRYVHGNNIGQVHETMNNVHPQLILRQASVI